MDPELIVWAIFLVIWLLGGVVKQFRRLTANRPGQSPSDPRPAVDTTSPPWQSEPPPPPLHQREADAAESAPRRPPTRQPPREEAREVDVPPEMPPLLGELMKQFGLEVEQPERPREGHLADRRTPSEHEHTPGWHERTASEHERGSRWRERTASEQERTAAEHRRTAAEHRGTRSEHVLTRGEHMPGEAKAKRYGASIPASTIPWGARRAARRHPVVRDLHGHQSLVRAFLAQEILGPPKALRDAKSAP